MRSQRVVVQTVERTRFGAEIEIDIRLQRHQRSRDHDIRAELFDVLAQLGFLDLAGAANHFIRRAELFDEFDGRFFTDAGDAGDVVDFVAHQRLDFDRL